MNQSINQSINRNLKKERKPIKHKLDFSYSLFIYTNVVGLTNKRGGEISVRAVLAVINRPL